MSQPSGVRRRSDRRRSSGLKPPILKREDQRVSEVRSDGRPIEPWPILVFKAILRKTTSKKTKVTFNEIIRAIQVQYPYYSQKKNEAALLAGVRGPLTSEHAHPAFYHEIRSDETRLYGINEGYLFDPWTGTLRNPEEESRSQKQHTSRAEEEPEQAVVNDGPGHDGYEAYNPTEKEQASDEEFGNKYPGDEIPDEEDDVPYNHPFVNRARAKSKQVFPLQEIPSTVDLTTAQRPTTAAFIKILLQRLEEAAPMDQEMEEGKGKGKAPADNVEKEKDKDKAKGKAPVIPLEKEKGEDKDLIVPVEKRKGKGKAPKTPLNQPVYDPPRKSTFARFPRSNKKRT